jgi:pimeloyl-ACP methyl ester carboxylesterase
MGFNSLRVDLAGMGDSPPRPGLTNQQSVAADFADIFGVLESRLGRLPLVLAGLCTGADNAASLALKEPRVVGMVLWIRSAFRTLVSRYGWWSQGTRLLLDMSRGLSVVSII